MCAAHTPTLVRHDMPRPTPRPRPLWEDDDPLDEAWSGEQACDFFDFEPELVLPDRRWGTWTDRARRRCRRWLAGAIVAMLLAAVSAVHAHDDERSRLESVAVGAATG